MKLFRRLRTLFRKGKLDAEMQQEMRAHLEMQAERNRTAGMDAAEARDAALRQFGNVASIQERAREGRGWVWLEQAGQDLGYAARQMRRSPGFSISVVAMLALAIGACSAIFTAVNSLLLRPIGYPESDRLMVLQEAKPPQFASFTTAPANFSDWSREADLFESMYAVQGTGLNLVGEGDPVQVLTAFVTGPCFATLRMQPQLGRVFGPDEEEAGKNKVVVLTHAFWQAKLGGRPDVLGHTLQLQGTPYTVIGVMPPEFDRASGNAYEIYAPATFPERIRQNRSLRLLSLALGRLKAGVTVEQARSQLEAISSRLAQQFPVTNAGWTVRVRPLLEYEVGAVRPTLHVLAAAVGVLLLIACVNVAGLSLMRASARSRELAVRSALGAGGGRIVRQLLVEGLLLAFVGGGLGLLCAKWSLGVLVAAAPADLPRAGEIALDGRVVSFALGIALLPGVIFGLAPSGIALSGRMPDGLRAGPVGGGGRALRAFRQGLVVAQIALALMLLAAAGLLLRSFVRLQRTSPGFEPAGALMLWVIAPRNNTPEKQTAFAATVLERFKALPGVTAVGATPAVPFSGNYRARPVECEGDKVLPPGERPVAVHYAVTPEYFAAMGIPVVRGRIFDERDRAGGARVAIVSQSFAERHFPGQEAIGRRVNLETRGQAWQEIVGVVGDIRPNDFESEALPQVYEPLAQSPSPAVTFVVRAGSEIAALPPLLRRELRAVDATLPVFMMEPLTRLVEKKMTRHRFAMLLVGTFAGVALVLAVAGVYGTMAYMVAQRTSEFGVRFALGARPVDVLRLVIGRGLALTAAGAVLGAAGAFAAARLIQSQLYQTSARDPWVLTGVVGLIMLAGLLSCLLPARRAAKVDPMVALRAE